MSSDSWYGRITGEEPRCIMITVHFLGSQADIHATAPVDWPQGQWTPLLASSAQYLIRGEGRRTGTITRFEAILPPTIQLKPTSNLFSWNRLPRGCRANKLSPFSLRNSKKSYLIYVTHSRTLRSLPRNSTFLHGTWHSSPSAFPRGVELAI